MATMLCWPAVFVRPSHLPETSGLMGEGYLPPLASNNPPVDCVLGLSTFFLRLLAH